MVEQKKKKEKECFSDSSWQPCPHMMYDSAERQNSKEKIEHNLLECILHLLKQTFKWGYKYESDARGYHSSFIKDLLHLKFK